MSSFLNSVLSSIGGTEPVKESATIPKPAGSGVKKPDASAKNTNLSSTPAAPPLKRKAEPLPNSPPAKVVRTETPVSRTITGGLASHPKPKPANAPSPVSTGPMRPGLTNTTSSITTKPISTLVKNSSTQSPSTAPSAAPNAAPSAAPSTAPAEKPPPKGSYREILQRAEAAKAAQAGYGQIKHKPVPKDPKLSRKERLAQEAEAAQKAKQAARSGKIGIRDARPQPGSRVGVKEAEQAKEKKKPIDLGYRGTMRQAPSAPTIAPASAYKGTMKTQPSTAARPSDRTPGKLVPNRPPDKTSTSKRYKYASYSDEEEEEEEEYDEESDMEAAGWDELEEEEQQSLRAAKKEDEEALKQESEHKRLKAEKRKKLEQLVASRRK